METIEFKLTDVERMGAFIRNNLGPENVKPKIGIICGTGLSKLGDRLQNVKTLAYAQIPGFPTSTMPGRNNNFLFGELEGKQVVCMQGRFFPFEFKDTAVCAIPVRVMVELGIETLILTSVAGGCNQKLECGDLMLIKDHLFIGGIALQGPLVGAADHDGQGRFISMDNAYDKELRETAKKVAKQEGINVKEGILAMAGGPHFETPAEVRMYQKLGADCISMSTCHEVVVARQCEKKVLAVAVITNMCCDDSDSAAELSFTEVLETGQKASGKTMNFVQGIVAAL